VKNIMESLDPTLKAWRKLASDRYKSIYDDDFVDTTFVIKWCESLLSVLKKNKDDKDFIFDVLDSGTEFFITELSKQEKRDAFGYILGIAARKDEEKGMV
jgi:hypothetical protein